MRSAVLNTFEHGDYELRELLDLPVVFISESSKHLVCQLAPTFSFVTHNEAMQLHIRQLAKRYALTDRMVPGTHLGLTYEDFPKLYKHPKSYVERFTTAARAAIARGAAMLMVAGNPFNMFLVDQGIREIDGVPMLDCCTAMVKTAEMQVDLEQLGTRSSTTGLFESPTSEARARLRQLFI
ncbi:MAG: allantoin racemase [Gammaproteobacteria bacterium]|jgi:allantoin racemase